MIAFDLECSEGHVFEGWFNNIESFEEQEANKMVSCPYCSDTRIRRFISPVALKTTSRFEEGRDANPIDYRRLAGEIVDYINKNFDNVGTTFTKEALKMHYGVTEKRNIRGSATAEEERLLKNEKIDFFKVPMPKIDDDSKT
ncbi:MAG: DUF1178 family protein [Desulfobacterales bacterium]|nr:DUF1178 family protein [Desulfobacterales bacterium]